MSHFQKSSGTISAAGVKILNSWTMEEKSWVTVLQFNTMYCSVLLFLSRFVFPSLWSLIRINKTFVWNKKSKVFCILRLINISLQSITATFCNFVSLFGINNAQNAHCVNTIDFYRRLMLWLWHSRSEVHQFYLTPASPPQWGQHSAIDSSDVSDVVTSFEIETLSASSPEQNANWWVVWLLCHQLRWSQMGRQPRLWRLISLKPTVGQQGKPGHILVFQCEHNASYCQPIRRE